MRVFWSSESLFRVNHYYIFYSNGYSMDGYKLMKSHDTWISSWVVSHVAASFINDGEFITQRLFLFKVGCMISTKYFDVPYGAVPIVDTIVLMR